MIDPNVRYLQSKQPVDDRAFNRQVLEHLGRFIRARSGTPRVLELGARGGTLAPRLADWSVIGSAEYTLVDPDSDRLAAARRHLEGWGSVTQSSVDAIAVEKGDGRLDVEFVCADLFEFLDGASRGDKYDLVLCHTALDLTHLETALPRLWQALAPGAGYWLTIGGQTVFLPELPLDTEVAALNHGTTTANAAETRTGYPETGRLLLALPRSGAQVLAAGSSDWVVFPVAGAYPGDEAYLLHHILENLHTAGERRGGLDHAGFADWSRTRHAQVDHAELVYIAHQLDVFGVVR